jgi:hypothetical protein
MVEKKKDSAATGSGEPMSHPGTEAWIDRRVDERLDKRGVGGGGGGDRIAELERQVTLIQGTMVTKHELSDAKMDLTRWMIGTMIAVAAAAFGAAKLFSPTPSVPPVTPLAAPPTSTVPPITINIPKEAFEPRQEQQARPQQQSSPKNK